MDTVTKREVEDFFKAGGPGNVVEVKLMNGFGFIQYDNEEDAKEVVPGTCIWSPTYMLFRAQQTNHLAMCCRVQQHSVSDFFTIQCSQNTYRSSTQTVVNSRVVALRFSLPAALVMRPASTLISLPIPGTLEPVALNSG